MPFDATQLWWPPFSRLYNQLSSCKLEPSAASAEALQSSLKEYDRWLSSGVSGFKPLNDKSRKALESEASLTIGDKKMPVDPALRLPALEVSRHLGLDEVQSYILLRRWAAGAAGTAGAAGGSLPPTGLTGTQLAELGEAYCRERLCLLKATEGLLWLGEEIGSGPFPDVVESTLASLLEAGLEDASFQALKDNLEGPSAGTAGSSGGGGTAAAAALPAPGGFTSLFGVGGSGIGGAAAAAGGGGGGGAAMGAGAVPAGGLLGDEQLGAERCCLLNILTLIYYHPRKQCTPERFLSLARLFHTRLFSAPLPRQAGGDGEASPARLALKLASVLLLEMLDVDKALSAVAENTPLTEENYAFAAPATRQQVNAELSSWWPQAGSAHAPVLLAWASVLCLIGRSGGQEGGSGTHVGAEEYGGHAQRAHETGALSTLCTLSSHAGMAPNAAEMASNILLSVLSAVVCAFDLSPLTMPLSLTDQVVTILCNLYQDQPSLCDSFWAEDRITEEPLRHFLGDVRGLFPAFPAPLYRMLCALSATSDAAVAANAYLAALPALVCIHSGLDVGEAILQDVEDDSSVYTQQVLALPGSRALTLPEGVVGEVLALPEGAYGPNEALLLAGTGALAADSLLLVRWQLPLAEGTGQWVLLCRAFEAVAALQQACNSVDAAANEPALRTALVELRAALRLLSAICSHDPPTALELLHVEVPAGEGGGGGGAGESGPDVLSLACHAATVLCQMAEPPAEAIGDCFAICASLAHSIPGRVHCELMGVLQLAGGLLADAAAAQDVPVLSRLLAVEGTAGKYPATLAVLQLLAGLMGSGVPGRELQVCVAWVLRRVLSEHHRWRYAERAERWRLAGAALRLLRHALAAAPPAGLGTGSLADAVEVLLQYDVGVTACLLPALPPAAKTLERMSLDPRREAEVLAVEDCCLEWMRLLPALLPAPGHGGAVGGGGSALGAGGFFREPQAAGAPCAAAVLLSYLAYEFFGSTERALVLRAVHSLACAAATAAPGLAFAALLPSEGGSLSPVVKSLMRSALEPQPALSNPQLAIAIFGLLTTAVQHHASLADALLFPCKLEKALKENRDANTPAATPQPGAVMKKEGGSKKGGAEAGSCLDAAWALLQETEKLRKERPEVLAALLRLLSTLWQSGAAAFRPLAILRQQPQTWKLITSLITAATTAPAGSLAPSTDAVGASDGSTQPAASSLSEGWREKEAEAWVVAAEASALQVVAAECFMAASSLSPAEALPRELKEVFKKDGAMLPALLNRYSAPLPTAHLLGHVQQAAAAAGLQLLGEALADDTVWPSLVAGPSVVSSLHSGASTLLSQFGGRESAAAALSEHAAEIVDRNAGQVVVTQVGEVVMGLAEVPPRLLEGREFGAGYAFDAQLCMRRLGSVLSQQSPAAQMLLGWLAAASVAASMEDARLAASAALKALLTGLHRYSARLSQGSPAGVLPTPTQQQLLGGISTMAAAADDIISQSLGQADGEDAAMAPTQPASSCSLDLQSVHIAGSAEGAYVLLVLLRQWSAAGAGDEAARIELSTRLLELVSRWLGSLSDVLAASREDGSSSSSSTLQAISSITDSLLAAALLAVSTLPALEDVAPKPDNAPTQALQAAAAKCMPALLAACQRQRQHLAEAAGLATALMERCVPSPVVLPVVRASLNLGGLLADLLRALISNGLKRQTGGPACAEFPALAAGQQPRQPQQLQQQQRWRRGEEAGGGSSSEGDEIGAALLLALQVAQVPGGAQLLLEQGVGGHVLLLCKWLLVPDGGGLMGETVAEATAPTQPVDYSNAYFQDGSPNPAHQLWCSGLSLMGLLLAALPGYESVESAALELAVAGEGRLLLAVEPPAGTKQQPITLSMLQETRYSLFFLTGLARLAGRWRALLPDSLPQLRQASASLLDFVAHPKESAHCQPVSLEEKATARGASAAAGGSTGISFTEGWVAALAGDKQGAATSAAIHMAERLYSSAQCALSFQLATAPEVGEEEATLLGPEWATPQTLSALQDQCLSLIQAVPRSQATPVLRVLCRTVAAVLAGTMQLQQAMVAQVPHQRMLQMTKAVQVVQQMLKGS